MAKKSSAFRIRIEQQLHQEFLEACRRADRPAAQVLREFMRNYVAEDHQASQSQLFDDEPMRRSS